VFVEFIELLRCPNAHEETPLIAAATRTVDRHLVDATLGCPVCHAEYVVRDGVTRVGAASPVNGDAPDADLAMRLAAFLELNDPRRFAILTGRFASQADQLARIAATPLVLVNAPADVQADAAASIVAAVALPLAAGAAHAAAIDESASAELAESITRVVRSGGRLVGPVTRALPTGVREIVRDERLWVAEKIAAPVNPTPRLVTLKRA
jgi:uncharacterized protein YbaR (Trm112 family)